MRPHPYPQRQLLGVQHSVESRSSSGMQALVGWPCSTGWSPTHAHIGSSKWTQQVIPKGNRKLGGRDIEERVVEETEGGLGGGWDKKTLYIYMKNSQQVNKNTFHCRQLNYFLFFQSLCAQTTF